ncbi:MAG: membrane protein insertase YidC [Kineosporiaceae bacterium]
MDLWNSLLSLLHPIEWLVAWIMVAFHSAFAAIGLPAESGWTWALSIVGLVVVIRILLIPLFVKQIKASRGMQLIQPELKKIQAKYKGKTDPESRQAMTQETMALYKETGTNPFSSCLPILAQSPIFFALFRVLNGIHAVAMGNQEPIGPLDRALAAQADQATLFGAPLSEKFIGAETLSTQILTIVLIVLMSASTFTTERQLMMKNMPAAALDNPFAQQQRGQLPHRGAALLAHHERVVDGAAVLRDPPDAGARVPRRAGPGGASRQAGEGPLRCRSGGGQRRHGLRPARGTAPAAETPDA